MEATVEQMENISNMAKSSKRRTTKKTTKGRPMTVPSRPLITRRKKLPKPKRRR